MKDLRRAWPGLRDRLRGRRLALFLDLDGTLSPLASAPARASVPRATREILRRLARRRDVLLAVISGRTAADARRLVGLGGIIYAVNHGRRIAGGGLRFAEPIAPGPRAALREIRRRAAPPARRLPGALIEDKGAGGLAFHWRRCSPRDAARLRRLAARAAACFVARGEVRPLAGKMVREYLPAGAGDKGRAVRLILARRPGRFPIYLGDDGTDEDAFRALGRRGLTVRIGRRRGSAARYFLPDTAAAARFLRDLARTPAERGA